MKLLVYFLTCLTCLAANTWYVDQAAVAGGNTGANWANAWSNFASISWASVAGGDTIYLSGGDYSEHLTVGTSGTTNAYVTVKASQESGHNGLVTISNGVSCSRDWVIIDGAKSDTYATNITSCSAVELVTNNVGIRISGTNSIVYAGSGPSGLVLKWLEITSADVNNSDGIHLNPNSPRNIYSNEIAYCWIHDTGQDGMSQKAGAPSVQDFDLIVVHHCLIERTGDDGIESDPGLTVHDCIIRSTTQKRGHPDAIQTAGNYIRIYNNIVWDWNSSNLRIDGKGTSGQTNTFGPIQVYGNLIYTVNLPASATTVECSWFDDNYVTLAYYTNWLILNNTIAYAGNGALTITKRDYPTNSYMNAMRLLNNIAYQSTNGSFGVRGGTNMPAGVEGESFWTYDDVEYDYNIIAGGYTNINYSTNIFAGADAMNAGTIWKHNIGTLPLFQGAYDFRPAVGSVAIKAGTNLTALALPGFDKDIYGVSRGTMGNWDIGALAQGTTDTNLLVWITFENTFSSDGYCADVSGYGRHAWRFGVPGTSYPSNSITPITVTAAAPGLSSSYGNAGQFIWYTNDYGIGKSGSYGAITNDMQSLTNMAEATICVWAKYDSYTNIHTATAWSADGNARLLETGRSTGVPGNWMLGRENQYSSQNQTRFMIVTNGLIEPSYAWVDFPDMPVNNNTGDTTNWHHYAVVFSNGKFTNFYNGVAIASNDVSIITTTLKITQNTAAITPWIGVGVNPHGGTPALEDESGTDYPNNGWFNGKMDDLRIYSRVLSPSEIAAVYLAGANASSTRTININTLRVGRIASP